MTGRDECEHGSLRRSCALCDALAEIEELRAVAQHETDAAEAYKAQAESMRTRIESLRGSLKSASGWLLDAGDLEHAAWCRNQAGDMEPRP